MDNNQTVAEGIITPELYFLISKFLAAGPLEETAKVLVRELENKKVLPKRTDWEGNEHEQTFAELEQKYTHVGSNHLLEICCRIGPILDKELAPSVPGILSLLGAGRQNLLRTKETIYRPRSLLDYCTRLHGVSLPDSSVTKPIHNFQRVLIGREYGGPVRRKLLVPTNLYSKTKLLRRTVGHLSSVYCVLFDRTGRYIITGADDLLIKIWSTMDGRLLATLRGASSEITDIAINLDNTMLAAGSLDHILRVWDMQTTSPIAVLTGHTGMITSVNFCPSPRTDLKYLVTTSTDGSIAFWQYSTPRGQKITFAPKPIQYHEKLRPGQAQMMCTTFSPGGMFLAAGSADHHVRVYLMSDDGPKRILESEAYTDAVDSVQWSHRGLRFISGSKDGTAHIWTFESQQWKNTKLSMTERLPTCPELEEGKKLKVTMVAWDCSDKYVITAVNDFTIKIWHSKTAKLHCVLRGHKDELYVLESNPKDEHVLLSAGHDGQVFLWDIEQGVSVAHFINDIDGQGHGGVFDAKWSPDGTMIAATDSHGHILIFGLGVGPDKYKILPNELFFHTDYRPLLRDAQHHVVDEQTQIMPHLMPPPFLVDADGNPHPIKFQRFVPGRENCTTDQLIPNVTVGADGVIIEDNNSNMAAPQPNNNAAVVVAAVAAGGGGGAGSIGGGAGAGSNFSHIDRLIAALANRSGGGSATTPPSGSGGSNHSQLDRMIEALANRQGQDQAPDSNNRSARSADGNVLGNAPSTSQNANAILARRLSDVRIQQPRQGTTWGRPPEEQPPQQQALAPATFKFVRRIYVRPMKYAQLQNLKHTVFTAGQFEMQEYKREMRRRPIMINTSNSLVSQANSGRSRGPRTNGGAGRAGRRRLNDAGQRQPQPAYRTRAVRDQEEIDAPPPPHEEEEEESSTSSGDTSYSNVEENLEDSSEDSDTESSDYSDWVADTPGPNLEPPKRSKRKPLSRRRTFSDDSSDETAEQATTSAGAAAAKASRRSKKIVIPPTAANGEIPELYRPAEWLSEVIPRKAPYYPQMGDEVVYFRQGHHRYLEAVRQKKVYKLSHSSEPWNFHTLRDHELVRVIGIKYEIRPPRLCCLKLAIIDEDGNMSGTTFKIKYHDMPDVLDFIVLRQTFDLAVQRNWSIGDRFRCMIGDGWWMGQIESRHALSADFPDSYFMCFRVRWDNGEYEYMSPWDMEPIDENRLPDEVGGAVPVLAEEIRATLYQPKSEEWHRGDRDGSCRRIINGLEQVMRFSIAEHFLAPVDLNIYPDYAYFIEYPIDLTTIKSRFENHFYRRITSAQFDVRYMATNAEKYNRSHTNIVKHARIITDLCLRIVRESNDIDVAAVYHQLVDVYHSSESENDNESDIVPSTSTGPSTSAASARKNMSSTARRSNRIRSDGDWRSDCRQLLEMMWQRPDSAAFREPVDTIEFPDYLEIIATPMDLRTVKEDLLGGNYEDPLDFAKDVRLIFQNSKNYNTNKRSRIYSMTLRLSALFESHVKSVISNWKATRRRANKNKLSGRGSSSSPVKRPTRRNQKVSKPRRFVSSDDDDDDRPRGSQRRGVATVNGRNGQTRIAASINGGGGAAAVASTSSSNRVTSSSSLRRGGPGLEDTQPSTRSSRRKAASQEIEHDDDDEDEEEEAAIEDSDENTSPSSSDDTSDEATSDDEDDVSGTHAADDDDDNAHRRAHRRGRKRKNSSADEDSEESYNPNNDRRSYRRLNKSSKKNPKRAKSKRRSYENDDDDYDGETQAKRKRTNSTPAKRGIASASAQSQRKNPQRRNLKSSEDDGTAATASQLDESTQDTVSHHHHHTPKKKGRPPKVQSSTTNTLDGPSTSATASALLQESPSRNTRNQLNGSGNVHSIGAAATSVGGGGSSSGRRNVAESDHSYHLPVRGGRIAESDTDSREVASARPTRASVKRAFLHWGRGSDVEEEAEDSEEAEEILPTPTPTKFNGGGGGTNTSGSARELNGGGGILGTAGTGAMRQLRTNRNTVVEPQDDDDSDDGSDNEPLASSQTSQNRATNNHPPSSVAAAHAKTNIPHPLHLQRRTQPHAVAISIAPHMTRSHATTSTTSSIATSSTNNSAAAAAAPFTVHDHNYLGDSAGPSTSSAALRNTRRVLSRHQRNADELDISISSLDNSNRLLASRLRRGGLPTSTTTTTTSSSSNNRVLNSDLTASIQIAPTVRRGRSRYSQENSQTEADDDDDDDNEEEVEEDDKNAEQDEEEEEEDGGASDVGTDGGSTSTQNNASDSEDNQPLTTYVPAKQKAAARNTKQPDRTTKSQRGRPIRRASDDSYVCDDDDDDDYVVQQHSSRKHKNRSRKNRHGSSSGNAARSKRGSRNQKRPRYNEQSDEDNSYDYASQRKRRREINGDVVGSTGGNNNRATASSSSRGAEAAAAAPPTSSRRHHHHMDNGKDYNEDDDDDDENENDVDAHVNVDEHSTAESDEQLLSVSSRGRVRKITAKARGIFKE